MVIYSGMECSCKCTSCLVIEWTAGFSTFNFSSWLGKGSYPALTKSLAVSRGGHSNRLCTNTRDRGQELVKQSKPKIWKVKRSKAHHKLEKVKGQAQLKVNRIQNLIKTLYYTL